MTSRYGPHNPKDNPETVTISVPGPIGLPVDKDVAFRPELAKQRRQINILARIGRRP